MKISTINALKLGAAPVALGIALLATPAFAQDVPATSDLTNQQNSITTTPEPSTSSQDIIVTGSRIARRPELEGAAPLSVIQDEEFKLSGTVNVENVVNTLPQVIPGTTSFSNNPGGGVATLDLRGLGPTRTLILVNGRRYVFFDTSQLVDVNTIPQFLLDGVDVVTGGASAVYGSDALSGVINFRLRQDLVGLEAGGQYNITERGDARRYEAHIALGAEVADGRGHATVYASYFNRAPVFAAARDFSSAVQGDDGNGGFAPGGSSTLTQGRFRNFGGANGNGGVAGNFTNNGAVFDQPGVSRPRNGDLYNYGAVNYLQVPQERYTLGGYGEFEVAPNVKGYTEVTFINSQVRNALAATPVTGNFNIDLASQAQFLSAPDLAALRTIDARETAANAANVVGGVATPLADDPGVVNLFVQRRVSETGLRLQDDDRNAFRILVGAKGDLSSRFNYDLYYSYARTRNAEVQSGNISRTAFQGGLDGTAPPINVFGPNTLSPASVQQITIQAQNGDVSSLQVASGSVSGQLFNLGFGGDDVALAVGAEYRNVSSRFIPDTALSSGDVIGFNSGLPTQGNYHVEEGFAELRVPIAANRPFIEQLDIEGAARYSDYSLGAVGGVYTYAGQVTFAPVRDILFRGQYQRAIRAPNVGELFGGQSNNFPTATDPCATPAAATNPTIRALCIATGVPAAQVGNRNLQLNTQIQGTFGGNPNLQEETGDSYTFGAVLRPRFIPRLNITADFYNIKVRNSISVLGGGLNNSLNLCYNLIQDINSVYCQAFAGARNSAGILDGTVSPQILNANIGRLETQGIDLQVDYSLAVPFSFLTDTGRQKLNLSFLGTYTDKFDITAVAALPDVINNCAGRFGTVACGDPIPRFKWVTRASFIDGPLTTSVRWRHIGPVRDDDPATDFSVERLNAYNLVDLTFAIDLTDKYSLSIGVNNLLDKTPQIIGDNQQQTNTYPSTYDVLGRDFFVSTSLRF